MSENTSGARASTMSLILVPAIITLAITALRLVGELQNWSPKLFSREAGGGGALVGISWLAPVFGIYFAMKLSKAGEGPANAWRPVLFALLGVVCIALGFVVGPLITKDRISPLAFAPVIVGSIAAIVVQRRAHPRLFSVLMAYGYAARIPVAVLMLIAIRGNWGTHYDVAPSPSFPAMSWILKWVLIGALPQLVGWIAYTITTGILFGSLAVAIFHRSKQTEQAARA